MKKNFLASSIACIFLFIACTKNTPLKDGEILIRIQNSTTNNFQSLVAAEKEFGSINAGAVTNYQSFEKVIAYPGANFVMAGDTVYAGIGYCGTPPLPYLESGRYTLQIFYDNLLYAHYNARYIKE